MALLLAQDCTSGAFPYMKQNFSAVDQDCLHTVPLPSSKVPSVGCCTAGGISQASTSAAAERAAPEVDLGM